MKDTIKPHRASNQKGKSSGNHSWGFMIYHEQLRGLVGWGRWVGFLSGCGSSEVREYTAQ